MENFIFCAVDVTFTSRCPLILLGKVFFRISVNFQQSVCDGIHFKEKLRTRAWHQDNQ